MPTTVFYSIMIINLQPDAMLKTNRKINILEVHFLGADKLGIKRQLDNAQINVDIITEEVAREICAGTVDPRSMYDSFHSIHE